MLRKTFLPFLLLCGLSVGFHTPQQGRFTTGEHLEYRVHYGFLNAAEAVVDVSEKYHKIDGKTCYRVTATGRTTGLFDTMTKIRDSWQSFIDTQTLTPASFVMLQQEGKYRREQRVSFDQDDKTLVSTTKGTSNDWHEEQKTMKADANIHDVISGYYFLRTLDFDKLQPGQVVGVKAFYDNEFYPLKAKIGERETIKTKFGKIKTIKVSPLLPKNDLFDGKEAVRIWISDDENKVPVKVEFDLLVGAVALDLKAYRGLKTAFVFEQ